jgi:hypothetical protein
MMAPAANVMTCIRKAVSSNLGRNIGYAEDFRGFPKSVQADSEKVWRKPRNTSMRIVSTLAEIQIQHLANTSQEPYRWANRSSTENWWCGGLYTPVLYLEISWERIRTF